MLVVGPHRPYLEYVADVLPSLGEEGVSTCTLRDLVPEGGSATPETDRRVWQLKSSVAMVSAIEPAVALYEEPPTTGMTVETPWCRRVARPGRLGRGLRGVPPGTPHNEARDEVWDALVGVVLDAVEDELGEERGDDGDDGDEFDAYGVGSGGRRAARRRALAADAGLAYAVDRAWPVLEATDLVGDLWSVPAYLRRCAPWLTADEAALLQREDPAAWTDADLPLLDAARRRLGDPEASVAAGAGRRPRRRSGSGWPTSSSTSSPPTTRTCG